MTDFSALVQTPGILGVAPVYTQCTASDTFAADPDGKYELHYKNGATPTGILSIPDQISVIPVGSTSVAGFADLRVSASIGATTERVVTLGPTDTNRFRNSSGVITLTHATPTTLTLNIRRLPR